MERVYTIPLRNVKNVKRTIRAPRAIREVKNFLTKHMKAEEVKIDESINHAIWERGALSTRESSTASTQLFRALTPKPS